MKILLISPPLTSPSGPYPSICYIAGFLDTIGYRASLADAGLTLLLKVFSRRGIDALVHELRHRIEAGKIPQDKKLKSFLARANQYAETIETAVAALQGRDHGALMRASRPSYFPPPLDPVGDCLKYSAFSILNYRRQLGELSNVQQAKLLAAQPSWRFAFGAFSQTDEACFRASNLLADVCDVIGHAIDPDFRIFGYAEQLSEDPATFEPLRARLLKGDGFIDRQIDKISLDLLRAHAPDVVGITVPFEGALYGALRMAASFKTQSAGVRIVLGGGWINTALRNLSDPGIFDYVDFITLDDGERPLQCLLEHFEGLRPIDRLMRTFHRVDGKVIYASGSDESDIPFSKTGTPTYRGLPLDKYILYRTSLENFKASAGRRFNKLTLAHGCYWKKCAFCDTSLDYIARYEPAAVDLTVDRIKRLQDETGESGFHFVDEAMPPSLMRRLAERLLSEKMNIAWWGNLRFDEALVPIAPLLAESGCVEVSGGLEVASDRLLTLMQKGVSLDQAVRVCHALSSVGIHTHAYLMYGFPTQNAQETVDALEVVRQMFEAGILKSAFWHRFVLTAFSPVASNPHRFGIKLRSRETRPFCNYLLDYEELGTVEHHKFGNGLKMAVASFALGIELDRPVEEWWDQTVPTTTLSPGHVRGLITRSIATV